MNRIKAFLITAAVGLGANLVWANGGHFAVDDASIMPGANCGVETWVSRVRSTNIATVNPQCNFTGGSAWRSEEHTSELPSRGHLVCRLLLEKKEISHR